MLAVGLVGWMLRRADMRVRGWVVIVAAVLFVPIGYILPATVVFPVALTELILLLTATRRWESSVTITTNDPQVGLPATCCSLGCLPHGTADPFRARCTARSSEPAVFCRLSRTRMS
jgi:hypothetical protein